MTAYRTKVFFDGGCRPNPGRIEAAVVVRGAVHRFGDLGFGTSSDAEWLALIRAFELSLALGLGDIVLIGDAAGVIRQADAALRSGSAETEHARAFLALAAAAPLPRLRWVRRQQNLAGIALAKGHPR